MNVVAIPFLDESADVVARNLAIAANHPSIDEVWAIHESEEAPAWALSAGLPSHVRFLEERRIGTHRPGKGDAMNTAMERADRIGVERLHFYDADITNFGTGWIDGAETGADHGFEVVRHSFPRAATDAMITWMVTKPGFAIRYPGTVLPRIGQPLGGEVLLTRMALQTLARSPAVRARSDWGIDTIITFASVAAGHSLYEHHVADGKRHALYGSLDELRDMVLECLDTLADLPARDIPVIRHHSDLALPAPADMRKESAFSFEQSRQLVTQEWAVGEREVAESTPWAEQVHRLKGTGQYGFLDEALWYEVLRWGLGANGSANAEDGADSLFFRLWVARVLNYTTEHASRGYDHAMRYLQETVDAYERLAMRV